MEKILVNECSDCCMCSSCYDDFSMGEAWTNTCNIKYREFLSWFGKKDAPEIEFMMDNNEDGTPKFPDWCPLKEQKQIIIEWKEN